MTAANIITTIGEGLMGWDHVKDHTFKTRTYKMGVPDIIEFDPLRKDNDCMMAWDKFCEKYHAHIHCGDGKVECWFGDKRGYAVHVPIGTNRRRVMCKCMLRAIQDETEE